MFKHKKLCSSSVPEQKMDTPCCTRGSPDLEKKDGKKAGGKISSLAADDKEYDIIGENEDEEDFGKVRPMGRSATAPAVGGKVRGFTDRLFGRKDGS